MFYTREVIYLVAKQTSYIVEEFTMEKISAAGDNF